MGPYRNGRESDWLPARLARIGAAFPVHAEKSMAAERAFKGSGCRGRGTPLEVHHAAVRA
jgi:hypothetical protein